MRLADEILAFTRKLKAKGAQLLDDGVSVAAMERAANRSVEEEAAALYAPIAPEDWQITARLASGDLTTSAAPMRFGRALTIVAFNPSVIPVTLGGGLRVPTLEDVLVEITIENERPITQGTGAQSQQVPNLYCTLADFSVQTPRLVMRKLNYPDPAMQVNFRWRLGVGVYNDADIRMGCFTRYLTRAERASSEDGLS